jgi:stearoyl-CoA desaturase (delta-9 desaturase)
LGRCGNRESHNLERRIKPLRYHIDRQVTGDLKALGLAFASRSHQLDNQLVSDRDTGINAGRAVPLYLYHFGLDWFQVALFFAMLLACGFSITIGYHRLFSHITFRARWPIRLFTLVFGAAAFENSVLMWASEHRRHHKHVDHGDDPYNIAKGFFHAHIGWLIFKLNPDQPYDNVADLQKDKLVCWQDRYVQWIAVLVSFGLPPLLGFLWNGWRGALGAFLIAGVARIVILQHCTFLINSACHAVGRQPYSTRCTARDSLFLAFLTFGEGYHNYHHEFQHDYRNGVKPWQFDPTKWIIWTLSKLGLARDLRRVPAAIIRTAQQETGSRAAVSARRMFSGWPA